MAENRSHSTGTIHANDGTELFFRHNGAENERAGMLIVHGLGEHSGRYAHLVKKMLANGISVFAYDHRGHGQSSGKRGYVKLFLDYINDVDVMIKQFRETLSPRRPFFLLGHSMGGLIVLNYIQHASGDISGVIVSSPALGTASRPPAAKTFIARLLSIVTPFFSFDNELDPHYISHDSKVVADYINDPLVHRRITARWATEFMKTAELTANNAHLVKTPVLMQIAGSDRIVSPQISKAFFENISTADKTLRYYHGLYHEIYNEKDNDRKQVFEDLESWINGHI